jgi:hypothetical protein
MLAEGLKQLIGKVVGDETVLPFKAAIDLVRPNGDLLSEE